MKSRIVIVGGGPAAVSACWQLITEFESRSSSNGVEILVLEKGDSIGRGLPYREQNDCYLMNLPSDVMLAGFEKPGSFTQWLSVHSTSQHSDFPPRFYFGQYLEQLALEVQSKASRIGVSVQFKTQCEAINIKEISERTYEIETRQQSFVADYVILCTGHMPPIDYYGLLNQKNYINNPWEDNGYAKILSHKEIGILGSRLTAIDVLLKLKSLGYEGKMVMFSRNGLLPTVLSHEIPPYVLKHLTLANFSKLTKCGLLHLPLRNLLELFWKEVSEAENRKLSFDSIVKSAHDISPKTWIDEQIKLAEAGPKPWQQVLFAMYPIVPEIWSMLSIEDKKIFLEKYNSLFLTYLAAFPLENAYKIQHFLHSGELRIESGIKAVKPFANGFEITTNSKTHTTENLINATGAGYNIDDILIYRNMLNEGLVVKNPLGGIKVNPQTLEIKNSLGKFLPCFFAVGEPTRGECLATTDMTRVSMQLDRVSTQIAYKIQSKVPDKRLHDEAKMSYRFFPSLPKVQKKMTPHNSARFFTMPTKRSVKLLPLTGIAITGAYMYNSAFKGSP